MNRLDRVSMAWMWLTLLTLGSLVVFESQLLGPASAVVVMGIAGWKVRIIMSRFMEVGAAPPNWRLMYGSWIGVVLAVIIAGNYVAVSVQ